MNFKINLFVTVGLMLSLTGCMSKPFSTYYMATTSFKYDPSYTSYMLTMNGEEIGGGYGGSMSTNAIKVGPQIIKWKDSNSGKKHVATNQVMITRAQLKGKKYLAAHIYPDDTVEITTSFNWPDPTEKGINARREIMKKIIEKDK